MKKTFVLVVTMSFLLSPLMLGNVHGDLVAKDSSDFANKYEGDEWPPSGYPQTTGTATPNGGILEYNASASNYAETTAAMPQSYTIEFNLKILSQYEGAVGAFALWMSNAVDSTDNVWLFVANNDVKVYQGGYVSIASCTNDDAFHTFRIAHESGTSVFQLWRDGVQIGQDVATSNFVAADDLWWLGGTSAVGGSGQLDYFRWTDGAYAPVPEPTTMGLLLLGGLGTLLRRKK